MNFGRNLQAELDFYKLNVPARVPLIVTSEDIVFVSNEQPVIADLQPFRYQCEETFSSTTVSPQNSECLVVPTSCNSFASINKIKNGPKIIQASEISTTTKKTSKISVPTSPSLTKDDHPPVTKKATVTKHNLQPSFKYNIYDISNSDKTISYSCDKCDTSFTDQDSLKTHLLNSEICSPPFLCFLCSYSTEQNSLLKLHLAFEHNVSVILSCHYCSFINNSKELMEKHILNDHRNELYICDACTHTSTSLKQYKFHKLKCRGVFDIKDINKSKLEKSSHLTINLSDSTNYTAKGKSHKNNSYACPIQSDNSLGNKSFNKIEASDSCNENTMLPSLGKINMETYSEPSANNMQNKQLFNSSNISNDSRGINIFKNYNEVVFIDSEIISSDNINNSRNSTDSVKKDSNSVTAGNNCGNTLITSHQNESSINISYKSKDIPHKDSAGSEDISEDCKTLHRSKLVYKNPTKYYNSKELLTRSKRKRVNTELSKESQILNKRKKTSNLCYSTNIGEVCCIGDKCNNINNASKEISTIQKEILTRSKTKLTICSDLGNKLSSQNRQIKSKSSNKKSISFNYYQEINVNNRFKYRDKINAKNNTKSKVTKENTTKKNDLVIRKSIRKRKLVVK